jgi:hypothetical protein
MNATDSVRMHVFADLKPYICTFDGCSSMLDTFPSRKLWAEHEFTYHRSDVVFKCHECPREYNNEASFSEHLEEHYIAGLSHTQCLALISAARSTKPRPLAGQHCPLCLEGGWQTRRKFVTHLGRHMEDIALSALPHEEQSDSEAEDESLSTLNSRSTVPRPLAQLETTSAASTTPKPVREKIDNYADEIIRTDWRNGDAVNEANCPQFAADVLVYVRKRFFEVLAHEDAMLMARGLPLRLDSAGETTRKLTLENMKWVFEAKVKPITDHFRKELFLCGVCDNPTKFYTLDAVIQHFAAKHTSSFSMGAAVVYWKAEWPESLPFDPRPSASRHVQQFSGFNPTATYSDRNAPPSGHRLAKEPEHPFITNMQIHRPGQGPMTKSFRGLLDTQSDVNLISVKTVEELGLLMHARPISDMSAIRLHAIGGSIITPTSSIMITWHTNGKDHITYTKEFYILPQTLPEPAFDCLIGRETILQESFLTRNQDIY